MARIDALTHAGTRRPAIIHTCPLVLNAFGAADRHDRPFRNKHHSWPASSCVAGCHGDMRSPADVRIFTIKIWVTLCYSQAPYLCGKARGHIANYDRTIIRGRDLQRELPSIQRPVDGLPKSLLVQEGHTVAVVALMQRSAGLSREMRRSLDRDAPLIGGKQIDVSVAVPRSDERVLTHYLSVFARCFAFWSCVKRRDGNGKWQGGRLYALALDVQLLSAYEPRWMDLVYDEVAMSASCQEWTQIAEGLKNWLTKWVRPINFPKALGVFMLWPRIVDDLSRWDSMDLAQRNVLAHAAFALSSIGYTDWFIRDALGRQAQLEDELGSLVRGSQVGLGATFEENVCAPANMNSELPTTTEEDWHHGWDQLLVRLEFLNDELKQRPNLGAVENLERLCGELRSAVESIPISDTVVTARIDGAIDTLFSVCTRLQAEPSFQWLVDELVQQILARWYSAKQSCAESDALAALAEESEKVCARLEVSAERFKQAWLERETLQVAVDTTISQLRGVRAPAERRALERKKADEQRNLLDAEDALPRLEDELLACASPFEQPFDHGADYCAKAAQPGTGEGVNASESTVAMESAVDVRMSDDPAESGSYATGPEPRVDFEQHQEAIQTNAGTPAGENQSLPGATSQTEVGTQDRSWQAGSHPVPAIPEVAEPQAPLEDLYSAEAVERCKPIWMLLNEHHLGLAYQFTKALSVQDPDLKVPPPALLAAVALANELVLPDGSIREALPNYLNDLSPELFFQDGPHAWHTALNLLLVAATLRPMVLVPSVGAATVAGYLHLSNYPVLYGLIDEISGLSEKLQGFRIELAALKAVRTEAGTQMELEGLRQGASEWLETHAPAMTMKFSAATNVWRQWTKPQGVIHRLVSPVAMHETGSLAQVKQLVSDLSDPDEFLRLVRETDRRDLRRTRGEDIHSGALSQLERCAGEAVLLARKWIGLVESCGQHGSRLRALLSEVRLTLDKAAPRLAVELDNGEECERGLIKAAKAVVRSEFRAMQNLFDPGAQLPSAEPSAAEALAREVLLIPELHLFERWEVRATPVDVVSAISEWSNAPEGWEHAYRARVESGDLFGAELIAQDCPDPTLAERWGTELKQERESWRLALARAIADARREVEVGRAYGYLNDQDLGQFETELVRCQTQAEQVGKFDAAIAVVGSVRKALESNRTTRTDQVRRSLSEIRRNEETEAGITEVEKVLGLGDVATANELLHRLRDGKPVWPQGHTSADLFTDFFPSVEQDVDAWLESNPARAVVEGAMRSGHKVGPLDFHRLGVAQRDQAAKLYALWSDLKSRKRAEAGQLEAFFSGLGLSFKRVQSANERANNRDVWDLDIAELEDRTVCPVPHFGSMAKGRYRVICVWDQPAEEDILQFVGDSTLQKATIILYFARMKGHRWRELSRLAKTMRRTFLLIDEVMLVYLAAQSISRVSGFFQLALPFAYSAPYDATAGLVPPEMFYGRSAELDAVKGLNGRCFIYGGRQLGKTALLRRAEQSFHAPTAGRFSRWVDLRAEGIGVSRQAGDLWICLAEHLKTIKVLDSSVPIPNPSRKGSIDTVAQELRNFLGQDSDRRILLLLDEADRFFEQDGKSDFAETRRLKQLMDDTARRFKVVFAGLHNVLRMTERANHPLAHFGEPIKVGPLVDEDEIKEAEDLVRRPMAASGFCFESRSLVIRVLAQTNYYPSLIQLYCSHLLRHMQSRMAMVKRNSGPRYVITDRDIESVYSSGALRDEIRSKFRLTLQLDPRYEVVAYAIALAALRGAFTHADGLDWRSIRERGALYWWPEGFADTSELDFRVLLDEMVELGVLSDVRNGYYTLRNPNVLLLLGSQDEIEAVLVKDREPAVEFELSFRPPLKATPSSHIRNPLTYQQLRELMRSENTITALAGNSAGGIAQVVEALRDYVGGTAGVVLLDDCPDAPSFAKSLDRALKARDTEGNTLIVVPSTAPWSAGWIDAAEQKLNLLRSPSKFVSLVFLADPVTLWSAMRDRASFVGMRAPWMSLLPWTDEFVKHWLADHQLPSEKETRHQVRQVTGYWPSALQELVANCREEHELKRRIAEWSVSHIEPEDAKVWAEDLGLTIHDPKIVLQSLANWGEPATAVELAELGDVARDKVEQSLYWGDLLGLVVREGGDYWSLDPFISELLKRLHN